MIQLLPYITSLYLRIHILYVKADFFDFSYQKQDQQQEFVTLNFNHLMNEMYTNQKPLSCTIKNQFIYKQQKKEVKDGLISLKSYPLIEDLIYSFKNAFIMKYDYSQVLAQEDELPNLLTVNEGQKSIVLFLCSLHSFIITYEDQALNTEQIYKLIEQYVFQVIIDVLISWYLITFSIKDIQLKHTWHFFQQSSATQLIYNQKFRDINYQSVIIFINDNCLYNFKTPDQILSVIHQIILKIKNVIKKKMKIFLRN